MKYAVEDLIRDVMARLGEISRPQSSLACDVPWPEDILALKVRSLLGDVGRRLIREAPAESLAGDDGAVATSLEVGMRLMPCGLYAAEVELPEGFLRMVSAKMGEWTRGVSALSGPDDAGWERQWSAEPGIAGCTGRPRAYLDLTGRIPVVRLLGSRSPDDALEWFSAWCIPETDATDRFHFPKGLYGALVSSVVACIVDGSA